jgi:hypothetical protein
LEQNSSAKVDNKERATQISILLSMFKNENDIINVAIKKARLPPIDFPVTIFLNRKIGYLPPIIAASGSEIPSIKTEAK